MKYKNISSYFEFSYVKCCKCCSRSMVCVSVLFCAEVIHENQHIRVKQANKDCLQSTPTSLNSKLSKKHIILDRWIIKPLGDGICVEGHRRLIQFSIFTVVLNAE